MKYLVALLLICSILFLLAGNPPGIEAQSQTEISSELVEKAVPVSVSAFAINEYDDFVVADPEKREVIFFRINWRGKEANIIEMARQKY